MGESAKGNNKAKSVGGGRPAGSTGCKGRSALCSRAAFAVLRAEGKNFLGVTAKQEESHNAGAKKDKR